MKRKISEIIRDKRLNRNMSQAELANRLGVHVNDISRWENGYGHPSMSRIQGLMTELKISKKEFLDAV